MVAWVLVALVGGAADPTDPFAACEAKVTAAPAARESYQCFVAAGTKAHRLADAGRRLDQLAATDPTGGYALLARANIAEALAEPAAGDLYRTAAERAEAKGRLDAAAYSRMGEATYLSRGRRKLEAPAAIDRARRLAERSGDARVLTALDISEANLLNILQIDQQRAYQLLKRAEAAVFPGGPYSQRIGVLWSLSRTLTRRGRPAEVLQVLERMAQVAGAEKDDARVATALLNIVSWRNQYPDLPGSWDREQAIATVREGLAAARAGGNSRMEAGAYCQLGELQGGAEAHRNFAHCIELMRKTVRTDDLALMLAGSAVYAADEHPEDARRWADEALAISREGAYPQGIVDARVALAYLSWRTGRRDAAIADSFALLDAIENVRDHQAEDTGRAQMFSHFAHDYYRFADRLLGTDLDGASIATAFVVIERMRARVLLDALDAARATVALVPDVPARAQRERVWGRITDVQRDLQRIDLAASARRSLQDQLSQLEIDEAALTEELARADRRYGQLRRPQVPALADVQLALGEDEALLSFQLASAINPEKVGMPPPRSWLLLVTRRGHRAFPLPSRADVDSRVRLFLGLVERRDGAEVPAATHLGARLLGEALAALPPEIHRLILVPDGALHHLPFAVLRLPDGALLATRFEMAVAPSASVWLRWRRERPRTPAAVLAFGDPTISEGSAAPSRAFVQVGGPPLRPLPHARDEAAVAVERLAGESQLYVGGDASEARFRRVSLERFGVIHFAAHAVVDDEDGSRSAVVLAPGSPEDDGLLQPREVVRLALSDKVVLLSACHTVQGASLEGEGVLSLARAFFQAGARAVVGSLWAVRDDETAQVLDDFYRHLADGASVGAALAAAQRDGIRRGAPAAAWAGLAVLGDGEVVLVHGGRPRGGRTWLLAALLGLGAALVGLAVRRSWRR